GACTTECAFPPVPEGDAGCGCRVQGQGNGTSSFGLLCAALGFIGLARRRRRGGGRRGQGARLLALPFGAGVLLAATPAEAVVGTLDNVPAATLLIPYFEVETG